MRIIGVLPLHIRYIAILRQQIVTNAGLASKTLTSTVMIGAWTAPRMILCSAGRTPQHGRLKRKVADRRGYHGIFVASALSVSVMASGMVSRAD